MGHKKSKSNVNKFVDQPAEVPPTQAEEDLKPEEVEEPVEQEVSPNIVVKGDNKAAEALRGLQQEEGETQRLLKELEERDEINAPILKGRAKLTTWDYRLEWRAQIGRRMVLVSKDECATLRNAGYKVVLTLGHGPEGQPSRVYLLLENMAQAEKAIEATEAIQQWFATYGSDHWPFGLGEEIDQKLAEYEELEHQGKRGPTDWSFKIGRAVPGVYEWRAILLSRSRTPLSLAEAKKIGCKVYAALNFGLETKRGYDVRVENADAAKVLHNILVEARSLLGE
jgi:hypothetical protein